MTCREALRMTKTSTVRAYFETYPDRFCTTQEIAQSVGFSNLQVASAIQGLLIQSYVEAKYPDRGRGRHAAPQMYRRVREERITA